jgi:hypothetical protein
VIRDHDVDVFKGTIYHPIPEICRDAPDTVIAAALEDGTLALNKPIFSFRASDPKSNSPDSFLVVRLKTWLNKEKRYFELQSDVVPVFYPE